jgi:hypothetical protein
MPDDDVVEGKKDDDGKSRHSFWLKHDPKRPFRHTQHGGRRAIGGRSTVVVLSSRDA